MRILMMTVALSAAAAMAGSASAQNSLRVGQVLQGSFSSSDSKMDDGSYYRCYQVRTEAERTYRVSMRSSAFDTVLAAGPGTDCLDLSETNDDGKDMGTNSEIEFVSTGGVWTIRTNTLSEGETGRYDLSIVDGGRLVPTQSILPIAVGESVQGELQRSDRRAEDSSYYDCYILSVRQAQTLAIRMDSGDFDTFLGLYKGGTCDGDLLFNDDDSGGGTSAQIVERLNSGTYSVRANALGSNQVGAYNLGVTSRQ